MTAAAGNELFELLDQARRAEQIVLPAEVRIQLTGFDVVRLRLLSFRTVCTLGDFCAENPDAWKAYKLVYMNPELSIPKVAKIIGIPASTVRRWLKSEPLAGRDFYDCPLIVPEKSEQAGKEGK